MRDQPFDKSGSTLLSELEGILRDLEAAPMKWHSQVRNEFSSEFMDLCWTHQDTILAALRASASSAGKLTKPALVGNTRFGVGVSEDLVIGRAQREYEYQVTPEREAERMTKVRSFVQQVGNIANADKESAPNAEVRTCPTCGAAESSTHD